MRMILPPAPLVLIMAGLSAFLCTPVRAYELDEADSLFEKGAFQDALKIYDALYEQSAEPDNRNSAFLRACQCMTRLYRFGDAVERLRNTALPEAPEDRARFLILKNEVIGLYRTEYAELLRYDQIEEEGREIFSLTPAEVKYEMLNTYVHLWDLRDHLLTMRTQQEGYFLDIGDVDFGMYPTLFDFLIHTWSGFLIREMAVPFVHGGPDVDAGLLLTPDFERQVDLSDHPQLLAASLMAAASSAGGSAREEARERWKIRRLLLPLGYKGVYDLSGLAGDEAIHEEDDVSAYRNRACTILVDWSEIFQTEEGLAEAWYQAARMLHGEGRNVEAVEMCERVEREYEATAARLNAKALRSRITMPDLQVEMRTVLPPGTGAFFLTSKNLPRVYFRLYRVTPEKLRQQYLTYMDRSRYYREAEFGGWEDLLSSIWLTRDYGEKIVRSYLTWYRPHAAWEARTGDKGDYNPVTETLDPPPLENGLYLVLASGDDSFTIDESLVCAGILNVTELALAGLSRATAKAMEAYHGYLDSGGDDQVVDNVCRFYAFHFGDGTPLAGVRVDAWTSDGLEHREWKARPLSTDGEGMASLLLPLDLGPVRSGRWTVSPLARSKDNVAWSNRGLSAWHLMPRPFEVFLEVDRPIYRPGDRVGAKAILVRRTQGGFKVFDEGTDVTFVALDRNGREFFSETVALNQFGSASVAFDIPEGRRLGRYSLRVETSWAGYKPRRTVRFSVEEYLRPEFEVRLLPAEEAWTYDRPVEVKGSVAYYFGGPVADAAVQYRVIRRPHISRYHRFWLGDRDRGRGTRVAAGKTESDKAGRFAIQFTPVLAPQKYPGHLPDVSEFVVIAEARDAGGRTLEVRESYKAAREPVYLAIEPAKGFFTEADTLEFDARRLTVNDTPAPGQSTYQVFALREQEAGCGEDEPPRFCEAWPKPLDVQLQCFPNKILVAQGEIVHSSEEPATVSIPPLSPGAYRLVLKSLTDEAEEITYSRAFIVVGETPSNLPAALTDLALVEHYTYALGDTARFLIGSGDGPGAYHVEIHGPDSFLGHMLLDDGRPLKIVEVPVRDGMKGGVALRWLGFKDMRFHSGEAHAVVPWREKRLHIGVEGAKELKPGEEHRWHVRLLDADGRPAKGEILALMYDRSLDYYSVEHYYRELDNPWMDKLYRAEGRYIWPYHSAIWGRGRHFYISRGPLGEIEKAMFPRLKGQAAPRLKSKSIILERTRGGRWDAMESYYADGMQIRDPFAGGGGAMAVSVGWPPGEEVGAEEFDRAAAQRSAAVRERFSDTAFFRPHLVTAATDGSVELSFNAPEQLTAWKVDLFAHTRDAGEGRLTTEAVTRKDLMVRVDIPRFFREGDRGTITALVHNESGLRLCGEVRIDLTEARESVNHKINLGVNRRLFTLDPEELASFTWTADIPETATLYRVRATASGAIHPYRSPDIPGRGPTAVWIMEREPATEFSDSEERLLPILPFRQRLVECSHVLLDGPGSETIGLPASEGAGGTREAMVLRIEPALALTLLNTMPFLVEYPYVSVEKILNQYLPLSIMSAVFNEYPDLKEQASKIPERVSVVPPWDKASAERQMTLMETPWVWQSEGRPTGRKVIDLLDPALVEANRKACLDRLAAAQYPNGAFPWCPGGRPDAYMTLYVLAGFAKAKEYGISVPEKMTQKALNWLAFEIGSGLDPSERSLALTALAAYVITSYSGETYVSEKVGREEVGRWIEFLEEHIDELKSIARAHLARAYHNLAEDEKAVGMLDLAMDGAREDPVAGIYWTPEKYSWIWYRDTLEKHALLLRAVQEIRPGDERIQGMVKWLLFNRKGNVWKSTKHSAAAVYALLDYLGGVGALDADETFEIDWCGRTYSATVSPDTWLDEPLAWETEESGITQARAEARITKTGPGVTLAGLTLKYVTDRVPEPSEPGMLEVKRIYCKRVREGDEYHLKPIESGHKVSVGDEIEVRLKISARSQFEYMLLRDVKPAGFESESRLSTWKSAGLPYYEEHRDSVTNFFLSRIPHGEFTLSYVLRPTKPGVYRVGAAVLQSMYAPDMAAHSAGFVFGVVE